FFQAEDGIRDFHVTGVQTCALPICVDPAAFDPVDREGYLAIVQQQYVARFDVVRQVLVRDTHARRGAGARRHRRVEEKILSVTRSEERRVGKEWRYRRGGNQSEEKE